MAWSWHLATDWKLSDVAMWKTDFEYQHRRERSVAGYQMLGGTWCSGTGYGFPVGDARKSTMVRSRTSSTLSMPVLRLDLDVTPDWHVYFSGSYSHSLIDDNVIYPYGCYYEAACDPTQGGTAPPYFFAPDGTYDIYDYRDPGERRADALGEVIAAGAYQDWAAMLHIILSSADRSFIAV